MYDWPEAQGQNDAFWQRIATALAQKGIAASTTLERGRALREVWQDPELVLGQTCGLPLTRGEAGSAIAIARPTYAVEGCDPGTYRSVILARKGHASTLSDLHGKCVAINGWDSQSGCNALKDAFYEDLRAGPVFASVFVSGAHRASADAVAEGAADLCALDAVAWALYQLAEPARASTLQAIDWTRAMPSLPFITGQRHTQDIATLREVLAQASTGERPWIPAEILPATLSDYEPVREMDHNVSGLSLAPPGLA